MFSITFYLDLIKVKCLLTSLHCNDILKIITKSRKNYSNITKIICDIQNYYFITTLNCCTKKEIYIVYLLQEMNSSNIL